MGLHLILRLRGGGDPSAGFFQDNNKIGLARGGLIKQSIYKDSYLECSWLYSMSFELELVNSYQFNKLFNKKMPPTVVSVKKYMDAGFPWFQLYDEHIPTITETNNTVDVSLIEKTKSLSHFMSQFENVDECCICLENKINADITLCKHGMCSDCLTELLFANGTDFKCPLCRAQVTRDDVVVKSGIITDIDVVPNVQTLS